MTQLSDDCFAFGGDLMRTEEALGLLEDRLVPVVDNEDVPLRAAAGRVLAADFCAARAVPPHDNAAVDGYAVFFDDLADAAATRLPVTGRIAAGHPLGRSARPGEALRIFTGAPMPDGPDTVLMQEDCTADGEHVIIPPGIKPGANRRRAGEDIEKGGVILRAGQRLRPQDVGLAASVGLATLTVYRRLRVAVFSTGDEGREVGEDLPSGCIYDSNRYAVSALLESLGCEVGDLGILPDADGPGRKHAEKVAALTYKVALAHPDDLIRVKVVSLPELQGGADVFDWLDMGYEPLDLVFVAQEAACWFPGINQAARLDRKRMKDRERSRRYRERRRVARTLRHGVNVQQTDPPCVTV